MMAAGKDLLRKATIRDLHLIVQFKLNMFRDAGIIHLLPENCSKMILDTYKKLYDDGTAIHFLIEQEDKTVACAGAFLKSDIPFCFYKKPVYGFIGDVYTLPEYRRRGYAARLAEEVMYWLKTKGVGMIRLLASEQARSIYDGLGFKASDEMVLTVEEQYPD